MHINQRFSILPFPQFFSGNTLTLNIVVLPRDQNPLSMAIEQHGIIPNAPSFADANLAFTAHIFDGLSVFPHNFPPIANLALSTTPPTQARDLFEAMGNHLEITNQNGVNTNAALALLPKQAESAENDIRKTVLKYVPPSFFEVTNRRPLRSPNAVTDDSYRCAVKDAKPNPSFVPDTNAVSWGKVFAYLMRQPFLARQAGMIYQTSLEVEPAFFENGGWLFVALAPDSDYTAQFNADPAFVRRYAARIPALAPDQPRQLFAPVLFPVLHKNLETDPDPVPPSDYSDLFLEAAEFDDGFAKIVHCQQPPNRNLLVEENTGAHPIKDVGIRLGWDDVVILERYIRQMLADPSGQLSGRIDAPLGVFGYLIDVRDTENAANPWESLNLVGTIQPMVLPRDPDDDSLGVIQLGSFEGSLPYQVYPQQLDGDSTKNYWLPPYFASWNGHSMVLPDPDAALIYQTTNESIVDDPGIGNVGPAQNQLNQVYNPGPINTVLRYGRNYEFRIRMQDLSGGAPGIDQTPVNETTSDLVSCRFRRYVSPVQPRITELQPTGNDDDPIANSDAPTQVTQLNIRRPKLGYPAVVYTGKYTNPVQRLINQSNLGITVNEDDLNFNAEHRVGLGIADPDVNRIEITVEIASLKLDKAESVSGREDYVHLYTTDRFFPPINTEDDYEATLNIPIEYRDVRVLHSGNEVDVVNDFALEDDMDNLTRIVLPTGRVARLTIRAIAEEKDTAIHGVTNGEYYGFIHEGNKRLDNRYGETFELMAYAPSVDETGLLVQVPGVPRIQGIYMQPDVVDAFDGRLTTLLFGRQNSRQVNNVQQLADRLELGSTGLTLAGKKGERVVFGCSSRIRHTLSPDHSSITFASKSDLINHWLVCISLDIDRDWMWDAVQNRSLLVRRTKRYQHDENPESENALVGDIELIQTASFEALEKPDRNRTRLVFIDAVEPKKDKPDGASEPDFPDAIDLSYSLEVQFKTGHGDQQDPPESFSLLLPITTSPSQVPRIVSAGIALSPYVRDEAYSSTEARRRHLWIEFAEPVQDPQDVYFARVLANAPDQLISNNRPELFQAPEEPALPIDPEPILVVAEGATNELDGLNAMQPMVKSTSSDRHYLMPIPEGLHAEADELFGFFTYEIRLGHFRRADTEEMVWSTAQGRFGRRLRATGVQHPAPILRCVPNRDAKKIWVKAPYAVAVHNGKNVTADPPRTELWALLYAQIKQADNLDYRNILLDDRQLDWRVEVEPEPRPGRTETGSFTNVLRRYNDEELSVLQAISLKNFSYEFNPANFQNVLKLAEISRRNRDATRYGTTVWTQQEVRQLLQLFCLPEKSPLSVVVVEILPQITNIRDHVSRLDKPRVAAATANLVQTSDRLVYEAQVNQSREQPAFAVVARRPSPVSDELGHHRILRTSPLTPVPEVCCADC